MDYKEAAMLKNLANYEAPMMEQQKLTPEMINQLKEYEQYRSRERDGQMVQQALQQAITEVVQRIAMTIINDRRAEIEAACNFGELRDTIAAELARQFMAARFLGQPTAFDRPSNGGAGVGAQGYSVKSPPKVAP